MIIRTKDITVTGCNDCLFKKSGQSMPNYCSHPESPNGYDSCINRDQSSRNLITPDWCVGKAKKIDSVLDDGFTVGTSMTFNSMDELNSTVNKGLNDE